MYRRLYVAWRLHVSLNYSWRLAWLIAMSRQNL